MTLACSAGREGREPNDLSGGLGPAPMEGEDGDAAPTDDDEPPGATGDGGDPIPPDDGPPGETGADDGPGDEGPGDGALPPDVGEPPPLPPPPGVVHCEIDGRIVFEAEAFDAQSGYAELPRGDASGGTVIQVGDDGTVDYDLWFASSGRVYVWVRTHVPTNDSENNGLFIDLDGEPIEAPDDHPQAGVPDIYLKKVGWSWSPEWQGESGHSGPVTFEVDAGVHTLSIRKRKIERPEIDKVVLELVGEEPSALGPAVTRCEDL